MASVASITKALQAEGFPIELVKGEGYFYFAWVGEGYAETVSVYVNAFCHMSPARWLEEGRAAGAIMKADNAEIASAPASFKLKIGG